MSFALLPAWLFLCVLIVAPQLWWDPMRDWRVDFVIYPLWLLFIIFRGRLRQFFSFRAQDWLFLLLVLWILLSVVMNDASDLGWQYVGYYVKLFVLYRLVCASIADWRQLQQTGYALLVLALVIAIEGIQHANSSSGLGWAGQTFSWIDERAAQIGLNARIRWVGIFDGPGVFCVLFTSAAPFAFQYMVPPYRLITRVIAMATLTFPLLLAAYYTGSRGGILATAAMVGMFGLSRFRISTFKLALAAGAAGVALLAAPSYLTDTRDPYGSAQHRVDMWAKGIEMLEENPAFGVGRGNFRFHSGSLVAHNSGLEALGETGFPGTFLWIAVLYLGFRYPLARYRETTDPKEQQILLAVMISLAGYLVSSLFVSLETELQYFLLAMCAATARWTTAPPAFTRRDALFVAAIVGAYYLAFKLFVMSYY